MSIVQLGQYCDFINGGAWSDSEYVDHGIPVLKVSNCKNGGFSLSDINYLATHAATKYAKNKLCVGDVIIATVGSHPQQVESAAGRSSIVTKEVSGFYLNQNAVCLRTNNPDMLSQKYIAYLCKTEDFIHYIQNRGKGAANQMRIAIDAIKEYKFDLPNIEYQEHVASILSAYDDLIENNRRQIKLLEEAARRLYREWFVELRFPGHEGVNVVDGVPEGWSIRTLSEIFDYVRGKSYTSAELCEDTGILMVNLKNIKAYGGYVRNAEKRFKGKFKIEQSLKAGDIVMAVTDMTQERRLIGHVAVVPNFGEQAIISMDLIKLIPKCVSSEYLYATLNYGEYSRMLSPFANGTNVLHLKPDSIMNLEMIVPSHDVISLFSQFMKSIQDKIEFLEKQSLLSGKARDLLLPKLMSGEMEG